MEFFVNGVVRAVTQMGNNFTLDYPCQGEQTNCFPYTATLHPGKYRFYLWGASGGTRKSTIYGPGGYSTGVLTIGTIVSVYFFVGAEGTTRERSGQQIPGSFNGGGAGRNGADGRDSSGGGASDIRLIKSTLNHRIIVAGGGGGSGYYEKDMKGGSGGSMTGTKGDDYDSSCPGGGPGSDSNGGSSDKNQGTFGLGGSLTEFNGCGGGGGWFGGGGGYGGSAAGGGGSGFVFTQSNPNVLVPTLYTLKEAITSTSSNKGNGRIIFEILSFHKKESHLVISFHSISMHSFLFSVLLTRT